MLHHQSTYFIASALRETAEVLCPQQSSTTLNQKGNDPLKAGGFRFHNHFVSFINRSG